MKLAHRVALVTGASTGIGRATAKSLADAGAKVGLAARTVPKLESLAAEIEVEGGEALVLPSDVREREQIESMVQSVVERFGRLDILVNNAGVGQWEWESATDADPEAWRDEIEVNLLGLMDTTLVTVPVMLRQGSGHIVNVSSLGARYPGSKWPGYMASKAGVNGFTQTIMHDLRKRGIRVTLIEPGGVYTPMVADYVDDQRRRLTAEDVADAITYAVSRPEHVCVSDIQLLRT